MFLIVILGRSYIIDRTSSLSSLEKMYKAFMRDAISIGAYLINKHENPYLALTKNWVHTDKDGQEFVRKLLIVRNIPLVSEKYISDKEQYENYKETYDWFQELSSFAPKLT